MSEVKQMTVAGKTFTLNNLVQSNTLEVQLANVFHILQMQSREMETQKKELDDVKKRMSEIDDLHRKVAAVQTQLDSTVQRMTTLEKQQDTDREAVGVIEKRVTELEKLPTRVDIVEKNVKVQEETTNELKIDFEQLRNDARDALTLASTVTFFKTELMELQEDVTKVLHQAPHTERLMHQVQTNLEKSTEQLQSVVGKTAVMEGALGKIALTVDEFKQLRADLVQRVYLLENPKVDRMGGVEEMTKALEKQVKIMTQNWMSNWGAHEQSMTLLKQDVMLHVEQLRSKCDNLVGGGHAQSVDGASLTFVRMDEEERSMLQKAIEQHGRDIARIDTKKADAQLVLGVLAGKADSEQLDAKMDKAAFEERLAKLEAGMGRFGGGVAVLPAAAPPAEEPSLADQLQMGLVQAQDTAADVAQSAAAAQQQQAADLQAHLAAQRRGGPAAGEAAARPQTAPPDSLVGAAPIVTPEPLVPQQPVLQAPPRMDPAASAFVSESEQHARMLQQMSHSGRPGSSQGLGSGWQQQPQRGGKGGKRPSSTPPVLPGGAGPGGGQQQRSVPGPSVSDTPGGSLMSQKRLQQARMDKSHPSLRRGPQLSISASTNWAPAPGKIRPTTAGQPKGGGGGGHVTYATDRDGEAQGMGPLPTLKGIGDDVNEGWRGSAGGIDSGRSLPVTGAFDVQS